MPLFKILLEKGILEPEPVEEVKEEAKAGSEEIKDAKEEKRGSSATETPG